MARQPWKAYGRYGTVGFELVLSIVIAWWVGHWLDSKLFPGRWYLTVVLTIGGVYAGFRALWRTAKRAEAEMERLDADEARERERRVDEAMVRDRLARVEREIDDAERAGADHARGGREGGGGGRESGGGGRESGGGDA